MILPIPQLQSQLNPKPPTRSGPKAEARSPENSRLAKTEWLRSLVEGKEANGIPGNAIQMVGPLCAFAAELGLSPARFALAWYLSNPRVSTVILGASRIEQLDENILAGEDVKKLTSEVIKEINDIGRTPFLYPG